MSNPNSSSPKTKIIWRGFFWRLFFLFLTFFLLYFGFLVFSLNKNLNKITLSKNTLPTNIHNSKKSNEPVVNKKNSSINKLKGSQNNRINILLLGIGGENHSGKYLTDTIALASINPQTYQSAILSIPRDLYVQIPNTNYKTKINALYTYGLKNKSFSDDEATNLVISAVEKITGETINYYIILDFTGFKKIIKTIDGINVNVKNDIYDTHYPGPNFSYETFKLSKGFHHLDAETALKYARVRHIKGGDFGRAHRQQQIISAIREKALSLKILANPFKIIQLINILGEHLKTNITKQEIPAMIQLIHSVNIYQTTTQVLDAWSKNSLLKSTHVSLGGVYAYVLIPKIKTYAQIQSLAHNIFDLKKINENKLKIKKEAAKITLATDDYDSFIMFKKILQAWSYTNIKKASPQQALRCSDNKDMIISYNSKEKLFTLNDLAEKLDSTIIYENSTDITQDKKAFKNTSQDILLCITRQTTSFFEGENKSFNSKNTFPVLEQNILNSKGEVLFNKHNY